MGIDIQVFDSYREMSRAGADIVADEIRARPDALVCVATGDTPRGVYSGVEQLQGDESVSLDRVRIIKLDEWLGLPMDHPGSCDRFIHDNILGPWGICVDRFIGFEGTPVSPEADCQRVQQQLDSDGPIDLSILGLGINGHIGFNEPGDQLVSGCHIADLAPESQRHMSL